jgi:hypothetical protein
MPKGKHSQCAWEAVYLWFELNTSTWYFFIPENSWMKSNQARSYERIYLFLKTKAIDQVLEENSIVILYQKPRDVNWVVLQQKASINSILLPEEKIENLKVI